MVLLYHKKRHYHSGNPAFAGAGSKDLSGMPGLLLSERLSPAVCIIVIRTTKSSCYSDFSAEQLYAIIRRLQGYEAGPQEENRRLGSLFGEVLHEKEVIKPGTPS
jgi:hypothetical protein